MNYQPTHKLNYHGKRNVRRLYKLRKYKEYSDVVDAWYGEDTDGLATAVNVLNEFEATSKPVEYTCYYSQEFYTQVTALDTENSTHNLHEATITSATDAWAKFDVRPNEARPFDRMDVNYWLRYDGCVRQIFVTQTLSK